MITIFILGGCATAMFLSTTAFVQRDAPASRRGRVLSLQQGAGGTTYGIGLVLVGGLADLTSIRVAFIVGAWAMLLGFVVVNVRTGHWREAADGEMPPPTDETLNAESVRVGWRRMLFGAGQPVAEDFSGR